MLAAISESDSFTIVGLLLTLAGLLATFFSVQLSQWLMSLLATRAKWKAHKTNAGGASADARRECRGELGGSYNFVVLLVSVAIGIFIGFIICACFSVLELLGDSLLATVLTQSLWAFLLCYGLLTLFMLIYGYLVVGRSLNSEINPKPSGDAGTA